MRYDRATVRAEPDGGLIILLHATSAAPLAALRIGQSAVFLVHGLEERTLVVKALQVEAGGIIHLALVLDRVTGLGGLVNARAALPVVLRIVGHVSCHPVEHRDVLQGQAVGDVQGLVVELGRAKVGDAALDGVLPELIVRAVELLVDLHVRLLDAGVSSGGEIGGEVRQGAPSDAEAAIPGE